jgi:hypothetical protein
VVFATIQVMLPRPVILDGHELINVHCFAVNEAFVLGVNLSGKIVRLGALV